MYIGHTSDLKQRIKLHNKGGSILTKAYKTLEIIYFEEYNSKTEAMKRKYALKWIKK